MPKSLRWHVAVVLCAAAIAVAAGQTARQSALDDMVATERAFAKLGAEVGARESFLVYFADEAVTLDGEPRPARDDIRTWPPAKPGTKLLWEPRTGDIATSGDLGYLTGPVVTLLADGTRRTSCYMSIWKRQADQTFKVVIDFGIQTPEAVAFADGFVRAWSGSRYAGRTSAAESRASLEKAERALAGDARTPETAAAFLDATTADTRLYRKKMMPLIGKAAIEAWLSRTEGPTARDGAAGVRNMKTTHVETAASGELGYTWGSFAALADGKESPGNYVRVWGRDAEGRWHILVDVAR